MTESRGSKIRGGKEKSENVNFRNDEIDSR